MKNEPTVFPKTINGLHTTSCLRTEYCRTHDQPQLEQGQLLKMHNSTKTLSLIIHSNPSPVAVENY